MTSLYDPAIHFQDVSLTIHQNPIIKNVTGFIPRARITTFIGPSGAGKSTLLKLCNQLLSQTSGNILIDGKPVEQFNPIELRRYVGMALQSAPMIKGTVYDNLQLPKKLQNQTLSIEEANSILVDVGLDETFLKKDASDLSGGQQQRVSIARTLINRSKILLLDEITSALDQTAVKEIEELIQKINEQHGVTVIWITHNLQ
ncbi:MAG: ATP-binding cassette domain-containing protein, partial [Kurthia sp.]